MQRFTGALRGWDCFRLLSVLWDETNISASCKTTRVRRLMPFARALERRGSDLVGPSRKSENDPNLSHSGHGNVLWEMSSRCCGLPATSQAADCALAFLEQTENFRLFQVASNVNISSDAPSLEVASKCSCFPVFFHPCYCRISCMCGLHGVKNEGCRCHDFKPLTIPTRASTAPPENRSLFGCFVHVPNSKR